MKKLNKARKLSDEYDKEEDIFGDSDLENEYEGLSEFNPDEEESESDKWLAENDPNIVSGKETHEEYGDDEDDESHRNNILEDLGVGLNEQPQFETQQKKSNRFQQPTKEEIINLRKYTRPWEQRARETAALKADPSKNPQLARHCNII